MNTLVAIVGCVSLALLAWLCWIITTPYSEDT